MTRDDRQRVKDFILSRRMAQPGHTILAAVSGGADSMCLVDILCGMDMDILVCVAHYNHSLRGAESDRDEQFVKEQCSKRGLLCYCGKGRVRQMAEDAGRGIEETARAMRYSFLQETALACGADRIATAHNADDTVETVLMNIARGTGIDGLCGIPPVRDNIIRPLLCMTREDIESYLSLRGVENIFDSSNLDQTFTRNRLRHSVVPVLCAINPELPRSVLAMTDRLRSERDCMEQMARGFFDDSMTVGEDVWGDVKELLELHEAVRNRVIRLALGHIGVTGEHRVIKAVCDLLNSDSPSGRISLKDGKTVRRQYAQIVFSKDRKLPESFQPIVLEMNSENFIPEIGISITCGFGEIIHNLRNNLCFKSSEICGNISVRPRREGDAVELAGRKCTKSLKKLFIEEKIPKIDRARIPVFTDDKGLIAVMGLGVANRCVPAPGDPVITLTIGDT